MKLSDSTVQVLKNFSGINQSLQFKEGNTLKTISPLKTIFVEATVGESFPKEFALYDLNKLLAKVSLYKDAELSFDDDKINISTDNKKKSDYIKYCSPKVIVTPPEKSITFGTPDCSFSLSGHAAVAAEDVVRVGCIVVLRREACGVNLGPRWRRRCLPGI